MLILIPNVLDAQQLKTINDKLTHTDAWVDGRATAGYQGAPVKFNQQIDEMSGTARECQEIVLAAVQKHPLFISGALPNSIYPPMFNRYSEGMTFGLHIDGSIRFPPAGGRKIRTDLSATLFLTPPDEYEGGELEIHEKYGIQSVKLSAGDMVLYPSTSLHQVTPITKGVRTACFFWVESLIRDDAQRAMLFEMDTAIQTLNATNADPEARRSLIGVYHNLIRAWANT